MAPTCRAVLPPASALVYIDLMLAVALFSLLAVGLSYLAIESFSSDPDEGERDIETGASSETDAPGDALDLVALVGAEDAPASDPAPEPRDAADHDAEYIFLGKEEQTVALDIDAEIEGVVHIVDLTGFEIADPRGGQVHETPEYASFCLRATSAQPVLAVLGSESSAAPLLHDDSGWRLSESADVLAIVVRESAGVGETPPPTEVVVNHPVLFHDAQSLTGSPAQA